MADEESKFVSDDLTTEERDRRLLALAKRAPGLLAIESSWRFSRRMGRLGFRISLAITGTVGAIALFGEHIAKLKKLFFGG